jgi:hypothetical protein
VSQRREEFERLSRAFAARDQSRPGHQCPSAEELFDAASGGLERERRLAIVDHVSQCAECTQAWRLAMELGARPTETSAGTGGQASPSLHTRGMRLQRFAFAASVVLAVGVVTYLALPVDEGTPQYRDVVDPLAPVSRVTGSLPRDRFVLRWSAGPQGTTYTVRLSTADLASLLVRSDIQDVELTVPGAVLANVRSGEELLWQVEARLPNGRRVVSETYVVRVE